MEVCIPVSSGQQLIDDSWNHWTSHDRPSLSSKSKGHHFDAQILSRKNSSAFWVLKVNLFTIISASTKFHANIEVHRRFTITSNRFSGETIVGKLGPKTSASKIPTRAPIPASVYARFTATVDFPTPPCEKKSQCSLVKRIMICWYARSYKILACLAAWNCYDVRNLLQSFWKLPSIRWLCRLRRHCDIYLLNPWKCCNNLVRLLFELYGSSQ